MTESAPPIVPTLSLPLNNFSASPTASFDGMLARAAAADRVGIDRVMVVDHVVMGQNIDAYDGGGFPTGPDGPWLEPLTVLSVIAGMTKRVRLATGILIAPLRRPVVLAKAVATLDVLSGGRVDLGVGVGWQREEYEAAGLAFEHRGRLLDETLEVCRRLWRDQPASYHSEGLNFDDTWCAPRPLQPAGVPIWVSGRIHQKTIARVVRFGDGWIPWAEDRDDPRPGIERLREALAAAGRDSTRLQVRGVLPIPASADGGLELGPAMHGARELVARGVTDFHLHIGLPDEPDGTAELLAQVVAAFAAATGRTPAPEA